MADACRTLSDGQKDLVPLEQSKLLVGSTAVDVTSAQFLQTDAGWELHIGTLYTTPRAPVGDVTVAVYVDADGRAENNGPLGPRTGSDTVFAITFKNGGWRVTKEKFIEGDGWKVYATKITYKLEDNGYRITIPYAELSKDSRAPWRAGVGVIKEGTSSIDYAPDRGLSCAPTIGGGTTSGIADIPISHGRISIDTFSKVFAAVILVVSVGVLLWKRIRKP